MKNKLIIFGLILPSALLLGCSSNHSITLTILTTHHLNPDANEHSKPIPISVFELTQPIPFKTSHYRDLINTPVRSLARTLIDFQHVEVRPHSRHDIVINLTPDARYLGICAGFHQLSISKWRITLPLNHSSTHQHQTVYIGSNRINVDTKEPGL
ncbi:MAG: type VI secretion system lipoprotein TssJ [Coxiella sp. (in: Bacteria)]|nr:MAG: type VI secretion system lipoprotein TssJ [Coxiella sp. (in: g-proteobacteria)]